MNHDKEQDDFWAAIDRLEGGAKKSHDHLKRLFLLSTQQKIAIEHLDQKVEQLDQKVEHLDQKVGQLDQKVDEFKQETSERFDKIEDTLAIIVNHLKK